MEQVGVRVFDHLHFSEKGSKACCLHDFSPFDEVHLVFQCGMQFLCFANNECQSLW